MQRYTFLTYSICYMPAVIHVGIMVENELDTVWTEAIMFKPVCQLTSRPQQLYRFSVLV